MPNVADTAIARLEGLMNKIPENQRNDPRFIEAQRKLDLIKALNDNPVTGAMIDAGIALDKEATNLIEALPSVANATLDVVRGLGGAIIEGLDGAYDAARGKLDGKEPDVVAGLVVVTLTILTAVYLFHSAKTARDAF